MPGTTLLTERECQIVNLIARGMDAREISALLSISPSTIEAHVRSARLALNANNRAHLVMLACTAGYIEGIPAPAKQTDPGGTGA